MLCVVPIDVWMGDKSGQKIQQKLELITWPMIINGFCICYMLNVCVRVRVRVRACACVSKRKQKIYLKIGGKENNLKNGLIVAAKYSEVKSGNSENENTPYNILLREK